MVTTGLTWFEGLVVLKKNLMIAQCNHCSNRLYGIFMLMLASGPLYGFSFVKMSAVTKDDMDNQDFTTLIQAFAEAVESRGKLL